MKYFLNIIFLFFSLTLFAQVTEQPDTLVSAPVSSSVLSIPLESDTLNIDSVLHTLDRYPGIKDSFQYNTSEQAGGYEKALAFLENHPYFNFLKDPIRLNIDEKDESNDDTFFYLLWGIFFFYALLKTVFAKYHDNIFVLFFRASLRQQQIKEQLLQSPLSSLFFNLFFIISLSFFTAIVARNYSLFPHISFYDLWAFGVVLLSTIYIGKFLVIKTIGWILNIEKACDSYIFVVFLVNKVAGILLLPAILLATFPNKYLMAAIVVLAILLLSLLVIYRYWISYRQIKNEIKLSSFHFFLYLCAFEIAPLLIIKKVLTHLIDSTF